MAIRFLKRNRARRAPTVTERAQVLDGRHLWLHVTSPHGGRVGLQGRPGDFVPLTTDSIPRHDGTPLTVRLDDLPQAPEEHGLVVQTPRGKLVPVLASEGARLAVPPTRSPAAPGATSTFEVARSETGQVLVRHRPRDTTADVQGLGITEGSLFVSWACRNGDGGDLVATDSTGHTHVTVAGTQVGDAVTAVLPELSELPPDQPLALAVAGPTETLPLVRARNDLARPQRSVIMPSVTAHGRRLSLSWHPSGRLLLSSKVVAR